MDLVLRVGLTLPPILPTPSWRSGLNQVAIDTRCTQAKDPNFSDRKTSILTFFRHLRGVTPKTCATLATELDNVC